MKYWDILLYVLSIFIFFAVIFIFCYQMSSQPYLCLICLIWHLTANSSKTKDDTCTELHIKLFKIQRAIKRYKSINVFHLKLKVILECVLYHRDQYDCAKFHLCNCTGIRIMLYQYNYSTFMKNISAEHSNI